MKRESATLFITFYFAPQVFLFYFGATEKKEIIGKVELPCVIRPSQNRSL